MMVATESRDENPTQARNLNKVETRLTVSSFKTCTASSVCKREAMTCHMIGQVKCAEDNMSGATTIFILKRLCVINLILRT